MSPEIGQALIRLELLGWRRCGSGLREGRVYIGIDRPGRRAGRAAQAMPRVEGHATPEEEGAHAGGEPPEREISLSAELDLHADAAGPCGAHAALAPSRSEVGRGKGRERGSGGAAARVREHIRSRGTHGVDGVVMPAEEGRRRQRPRRWWSEVQCAGWI